MEPNNIIRFSPPHAQPNVPEDSFCESFEDDEPDLEWYDEEEFDDDLNPYFQNLPRVASEGLQAATEVFENHLNRVHAPNQEGMSAEQRWYDGALLKLFAILILMGETLPYFEEEDRTALAKIDRAIERVKRLRKASQSWD